MPGGEIRPRRQKPENDNGYFEIISKSVFQAGFSYKVVHDKWEGIREVFSNFDYKKVRDWDESDIMNALESPKVIRNSRKISAIVENAQTFGEIVKKHGSFSSFIDENRSKPYDEKTKLLGSKFKWLGKTGAFFFYYSINEQVPEWEKR